MADSLGGLQGSPFLAFSSATLPHIVTREVFDAFERCPVPSLRGALLVKILFL